MLVKESRPKHPAVKDMMARISGSEDNLLSADGPEWSSWRKIFNPGFASSHLTKLAPAIVADALIYCEILEKHARANDVFRLEEVATRLTIDIIAKVTM